MNPHSFFLADFTAEATVWSSLLYSSVADVASFMLSQLQSYVRNILDLVVYRTLASEWASKRGLIQVLVQVSHRNSSMHGECFDLRWYASGLRWTSMRRHSHSLETPPDCPTSSDDCHQGRQVEMDLSS